MLKLSHLSLAALLAASCSPATAPSVGGAAPAASPSAAPSVAPSIAVSATPQPTVAPSEAALGRIAGKVLDDQNREVVGALVEVIDAEGRTEASVKTGGGGEYAIESLPLYVSFKLRVTLGGYTPREKGVVLAEDGLTENFEDVYALSDRPEVVAVEPAVLATPMSPITIRFSEPMDRDATQAAFALLADDDVKMGIGYTMPVGLPRPDVANAIYTIGHFDYSWEDGDQALVLTPKPGTPIPADAGDSMGYRISFHYTGGGVEGLTDLSGNVGRTPVLAPEDGPFRGGSSGFRPFGFFRVPADDENPKLESVAFFPQEAGTSRDEIRVVFTKPMRLRARAEELAGGVDGDATKAPAQTGDVSAAAAAANYEISVDGGAWTNLGTALGASAVFDGVDDTNRTILIYTASDLFQGNETVAVRLASRVFDPQGNSASASTSGVSAVVP